MAHWTLEKSMKGLILLCMVLTAFSLLGGQEADTGGQGADTGGQGADNGGQEDGTGGQEDLPEYTSMLAGEV